MDDEARKALTRRIKMKGLELGFSHVGVIPCHDFPDYAAEVRERDGYERFIDNPASFYAGCFPSEFFPQGKSIVCATFGFGDVDYPPELLKYIGRIYLARCYVPVPDNVAGKRLEAMGEFLESQGMEVYRGNIELPARPICAEAGLVTYGNNNFAYTEEDGSFVVLYTWLVDAELAYDQAPVENECPPDCNLCLKACPTGAIESPRHLNPMKCILLNCLIPNGQADPKAMGTYIHGCDICQEVCPRNHDVLRRAKRKDSFLEKLAVDFDLERVAELDSLDDDYYRDVLRPVMYNYIRDPAVFRRNAERALAAEHIFEE